MSKRRKRRYEREPILGAETKRDIFIVFLFTIAGLSLLSYFGIAGKAGFFIDSVLKTFMGTLRILLPLTFITIGVVLARAEITASPIIGTILLTTSISGVFHLVKHPGEEGIAAIATGVGGGYLGLFFSYPLFQIFGLWASLIIFIALMLISLSLIFSTPLSALISSSHIILRILGKIGSFFLAPFKKTKIHGDYSDQEKQQKLEFEKHAIEHEEVEEEAIEEEFEEKIPLKPRKRMGEIIIPIDLLEKNGTKPAAGNIRERQEIIEKTLNNFGISVEMGDVSVGPTVAQYTFRPSVGVKLSSITALSNDLALALAAHPIRIEAPIPGKSLVGVEVPNTQFSTIRLREIIEGPEWNKNESKLTVIIGRDVTGKPFFADLAKMPHLLVAGSTGSGKSVCLNSIILSLLYQNGPDDLKFILVDPKRVELPTYNNIPHLITPVITTVKETVQVLRWAIMEMERRFEVLASSGSKDIEAYNKRSSSEEKMPYIVFIIDELADLMVAAANEVEGSIIRLAQMARAVGIHLILATQRPSVDVITGLIKANITSRIAFSVASLVDSRTIIDASGAEKLLGRGDMLFITAQLSKPKRLQGIFVSDREIKNVVAFLKTHGEPEFIELNTRNNQNMYEFSQGDGDSDPLLSESKEVIWQAGKASASLLQRRLKVGYARAARILDLLEEEGFIGPGDGAKPREILAPKDDI